MADYRGQVTFDGISKTYPTEAHVQCSYILSPTHTFSAYDYIGIFKVGWSKVKDVLYYIWVPSPKERVQGEESRGTVLFQAGNLPSDDREFYQFIYINDKGKMCGASSPFQFRPLRSEDFITEDMQEDEDMVFITTRHLQLEEKLNDLESEQDRLSRKCEELTDERTVLIGEKEKLQTLILSLEEEKTQILAQIQEAKSETECLTVKLAEQSGESQRAYEELKKEANNLEEKSQATDTLLAEKEQTITQLRNEIDHFAGQVEALRKERELYQDHSATAEAGKQQALNELASIRRCYDENLTEKEAVETLRIQLQSSQETIEDMEQNKRQQKEVIDDQHDRLLTLEAKHAIEKGDLVALKTELQETIEALKKNKRQQKEVIDGQHDKLLAVEARHVVDGSEINTLNETLANLSVKVENSQTEIFELRSKYEKAKKRYQTEKNDWDGTLVTMAKEKNSLLSTIGELNHRIEKLNVENVSSSVFEEQEDRYFALQAAYSLLKGELRTMETELLTLQRREAKLKNADRQAIQLQERLSTRQRQDRRSKSEDEAVKRGDRQQSPTKTPSRIESVVSDFVGPAIRSYSAWKAGGKEELSKEELQKMSEQLGTELELRTQKKDKYKSKYLDEKQRAATLRDYYKGEMEKLTRDLELARSQLDQQVSRPPTGPPSATPFAYPPVPRRSFEGTGSASTSRQTSTKSQGLAALVQSFTEDNTDKAPLKPLPAPIEPQKLTRSRSTSQDKEGGASQSRMGGANGDETSKVIRSSLNQRTATDHEDMPRTVYPEYSGEPLAARRRPREEIVISKNEESDEDNDGPDRYHDAFDVPASMVKCCVCEKVFDSTESEEMRSAHVMEHLENTNSGADHMSSIVNHFCPVCQKCFLKAGMTDEEFNTHVQAHFTITHNNY